TSSTIVQEAWDRGQEVAVHGWIYGIDNGLLTDLDVTVDREHGLANPR
ncbi:MAG TPA: carbonic anhydrase, partial [Shewanella sp.]|nr:carbonic anhydrase [Shewanella sp.]